MRRCRAIVASLDHRRARAGGPPDECRVNCNHPHLAVSEARPAVVASGGAGFR